MNNKLHLLSVIIILTSCFIFQSCKPITEVTEEITQVNYIVPIWKGSLPSAPANPEVGWAYYNTTVKNHLYMTKLLGKLWLKMELMDLV